jgi:hypothetical protein
MELLEQLILVVVVEVEAILEQEVLTRVVETVVQV